VSTNLASHFPHLLESVIVQAYHSRSPGPYADIWKFGRDVNYTESSWWSGNHRGKKFVLSTAIIAVFQRIGALSPVIQRLLIHGAQPLLVSAIFFLWLILYRNPAWWALPGALILYKVGSLLWTSYEDARRNSVDTNNIHPMKIGVAEMNKSLSSLPHEVSESSLLHQSPPVVSLEEYIVSENSMVDNDKSYQSYDAKDEDSINHQFDSDELNNTLWKAETDDDSSSPTGGIKGVLIRVHEENLSVNENSKGGNENSFLSSDVKDDGNNYQFESSELDDELWQVESDRASSSEGIKGALPHHFSSNSSWLSDPSSQSQIISEDSAFGDHSDTSLTSSHHKDSIDFEVDL
jgi:hypothetical protein